MPQPTIARWTGLSCPQCGAPTATTAPAEIPVGTAWIRNPEWIEWCTGRCLQAAVLLTPTLGAPPELAELAP